MSQEDQRLHEIARERAHKIAPKPTRWDHALVYFMLIVPGIFGGAFLADSMILIRISASLIWAAGFLYPFYGVQKRERAHERAFNKELNRLSR